MNQNISPKRGAAIAGFSALVLLVLTAAFDNQWLDNWRETQAGDGGSTAHSWFAGPVRALSALAWRATKVDGEPGRLYFGMLAEPLIAVLLTFLLLMLVCRGVGAQRGRWALFLGGWFVTGVAASVALIAGTGIAGIAVAGGKIDPDAGTYFGRGDVYYTLITFGLFFGMFAGWLVGFTAVLVYGSTEGSQNDGDERATREYPSPVIDYSDYSPPSYSPTSSSSASGPTGSNDDYSFTPTSPYSSNEPTPGYSGYDPGNAPTEVSAPRPESDPYGGGGRPH